VWFEFQMAPTNTATLRTAHVPNYNVWYFAVCYHYTIRHRDIISESAAPLNLFYSFQSIRHVKPTNYNNRTRHTAYFDNSSYLQRPRVNISMPYANSRISKVGLGHPASNSGPTQGIYLPRGCQHLCQLILPIFLTVQQNVASVNYF
jgi:hypothetical protein